MRTDFFCRTHRHYTKTATAEDCLQHGGIAIGLPCSFTGNYDMDFGEALKSLKSGTLVQRAGWNGKGMYLTHQKGYPDGIPINENTSKATGLPIGTVCRFDPYIVMKTAGGSFVPWLANQTDLLAEDWRVVESHDKA